MACSNCSTPCNDRFCSDCQFWDHFYSQPDPSGDEDSCLFCNQLKKKSIKQELVYDDGTSSSDAKDNKDEADGTTSEPSRWDHPLGSEESWTFYYNLIHPDNQLNIKLGDCVEVEVEEDGKSLTKVIRCQFLLRDTLKNPWLSGYEMVKTEDIPSLIKKGKKRKRKPVDEFPVSGDRVILDASECFIRVSNVKKIVCSLPLTDYEFGKPKGLDPVDVFSCGFRFDPITGCSMHFVIPDFKTCFDPLVWEKFIEPPGVDPIVIISCQSEPTSPSILKKEGTPRKSTNRLSFSANLVQQFEYDDE